MTDHPDPEGRDDPPASQIVISGLDTQQEQETEDANTSPTDEAVQRLQSQRARGEPEDEDG